MSPFRSIPVLAVCWAWMTSDLLAAQRPPGRQAVRTSLTEVDRWLAGSPHEEAWHQRLNTNELRRELARNESPDPAGLERWLHRVAAKGPIPGHAPLVALRRSV